jgi:hypothetical protein
MSDVDTLIFPRWLLPLDPAGRALTGHALAIDGGRIKAVLPAEQARRGRDEGFPNSPGKYGGVYVSLQVLNLLERSDHTDHRPEEAEHGSDAGDAGKQIRSFLEVEGLMLTRSLNGVLNFRNGPPQTLEALLKDSGNRDVLLIAVGNSPIFVPVSHVLPDPIRNRLGSGRGFPDGDESLDEQVDG